MLLDLELIVPGLVFQPVDNLFSFVLFADQVLSRFSRNITPAQLIGTDPGNGLLPAGKGLFFDSKRDCVFRTDFIAIMPVYDYVLPYDNRIERKSSSLLSG